MIERRLIGVPHPWPRTPLQTEQDYNEALKIVSALVDADPAAGTPEGDQLEVLATLVERYETEHLPMEGDK